MIQAKKLKKNYGAFTAVNEIDLNIPEGEIYGFLGPNGAGKTTTIMMLLGITQPTAGDIFLFGEKYNPNRFELRKRIGVVPEKHPFGMWKWMTVRDYLIFFADLFECKNPQSRMKYLLKQVNLPSIEHKRITELSRGMLQKLSFVRALLPDPDMLFLDEPISGLDPIGIKQIRDLILMENREGRTIFISSHLLSEMEKICDRVAIINSGRLVAEDKMDSLIANIAKDKEIHIDLESIPGDLENELENLEFVLGVVAEQNTLIVKVPKEGDFRKQLSGFLIGRDLIPLRLQEKTTSLEEIFVTINTENVAELAKLGGER